jgi:hypothetical protein
MYRSMETRLSNMKIKSENVVITSFTHSKASPAKECNCESILPEKDTSTATLKNPIN